MKKLTLSALALILTLTLTLTLATTVAFAENALYDAVMERGSLIIGTEGMWSPWTYHDLDTNELVGFDVEVGKAICEKLGIEAEFSEAPWDDILAALDSGRVDTMINGVEVTEQRAEKYDFSTPYCYVRTALVVRADNEDIKTFEDLEGRTTANSIGSTYMTLAESYGAIADGVDTLDETMEMVLSGRAEATLNAVDSVGDYLRVHPDANIKIVALTEEASPVAIPMRKGETALVDAVNQAIAELREDGTLSELSIKYFGNDITMESQGE